ncbi:MAG: cell division protein SepF [Lachnospiraceae bacterium]
MGFLDGFLNKMNFSTTDEYDGDYDDMDMTEENEEEEEETAAEEKKADQETPKTESAPASSTATFRKKAAKNTSSKVVSMNGVMKQSEVCMIIPKEYNDTKDIAEILLSGKTVVLNMEAMNFDTAQRVIDFTSGACFTMGGNLQKISKKIIIATPSNVELSGDFTELLGDDDSTDISSYSLKV